LGRVGQMRLDHVAPQADHLGRLVYQGSGVAVGLAWRGAADLEARLLQNLEGRSQNAFHLLGGQDFQRPPGIGEPRQGRERGTGGALGTPAVAAPGRCRNFGHGFACQFIPAPTALTAAVLALQPPGRCAPVSISSAPVRLSAVRDDYPTEEPQMQSVLRSMGVMGEAARRVGPYLMLEMLLPGGTVLALLLFLYRRRSAARLARGAALFSHRDFRNSTIAC